MFHLGTRANFLLFSHCLKHASNTWHKNWQWFGLKTPQIPTLSESVEFRCLYCPCREIPFLKRESLWKQERNVQFSWHLKSLIFLLPKPNVANLKLNWEKYLYITYIDKITWWIHFYTWIPVTSFIDYFKLLFSQRCLFIKHIMKPRYYLEISLKYRFKTPKHIFGGCISA